MNSLRRKHDSALSHGLYFDWQCNGAEAAVIAATARHETLGKDMVDCRVQISGI